MQESKDSKNSATTSDDTNKKDNYRGGLGFLGKKKTQSEPHKKQESATPPKQEKNLGFFKTHPLLPVNTVTPCISAKIFNGMAFLPWLFLSLLLIAQTVFTLEARNLWFLHEVSYASTFSTMLETGKWFALDLNGHAYQNSPPLYFWFLRGISMLLNQEGPFLYFLATAISGLLYLWTMMGLGRIVGRMDGRSLLASGIILLCSAYFSIALHSVQMDLLFSTFVIASQAMFFVGWGKIRSYTFIGIAFFLAGVACLINGPLGIVFPLLTSFLFLIWIGNIRRLLQLDVLVGVVILFVLIGAWLTGIFYETRNLDFLLENILEKQFIQKAVYVFSNNQSWLFYLNWLPLLCLPWILLIVCLPWHRVFGKNLREAVVASRKPEKEGLAFLWCMALSAIPLLSALSSKMLMDYLPAFSALALLAGRASLRLSLRGTIIFRILTILFFIGISIAFLLTAFFVFGVLDTPEWITLIPAWKLPMNTSFYLTAAILLVIAFALWLVPRKTSVESILIIIALGSIAVSFSTYQLIMPALDAVLSPKPQAEIMQEYIKQGYVPVSFGTVKDAYTYYAGSNVTEVNSWEKVSSIIKTKETVILGAELNLFNEWENKPECLKEVHRQWLAAKQYILAACPPLILPEHTSFESRSPSLHLTTETTLSPAEGDQSVNGEANNREEQQK